ncbi:hypothetical protein D9611_000484 [Ephemerocybe angulata]|uniref:Protein N-terminal and lysine N-methyltransferase EFM7 n=1 Tax=Ephemerocybe angulata TaxID=980116 RepID=A0A8H5BNI6_9AGAR|nr:hypothetical protein D9611_000484 [Tulosesus angulatus]
MSDDENFALDGIFPKEPPRPPTPEPTISTYHRNSSFIKGPGDWRDIDIRLVGDHPLWGHHLWNAARSFASYLDEHRELYENLNVLELGAGGGLPSLVAAKNNARLVVITDYPDDALIDNIEHNVKTNLSVEEQQKVSTQGYIWGRSTDGLLETASTRTGQKTYDLIILSDLVFNHSQHDALLTTCEATTSPKSSTTEPSVLVFYTHHRPHLAHRDMEFFSKAESRGWTVEKVVEERFPPMFPEDSGDETVRSTVHGWRLTRTSRPQA